MANRQQKGQVLNRLPRTLARYCIRGYQYFISPLINSHCRFSPTCSDYALGAYQQFGFFKATWLTVKRLLKCHPWHAGGVDPLPEPEKLPTEKNIDTSPSSKQHIH